MTSTSRSSRTRRIGATLVGLALIAAACSDKKDDEAVGGGTTEPGAAATTEAPGTTAAAPETTTGDTGGPATTDGGEPTETTEAPGTTLLTQATLPAPEGDPVVGGKLVVAGEAEVGAPWTPANVQCDSYCAMRIRTFIEPLFVTNQQLEVKGFLGESITPNEDSTEFTIKVREGITFHDGTPLNADAVIDNLNRTWTGLLVGGAMRDIAKETPGDPASKILVEKVDDYTFILKTGKNGDVNTPVKWYQFPYFLTAQPGYIASPTWLAAVDGNPDLATQPVGTGPFTVQSYTVGDRMTVVKNPTYWRQDEAGNQLPYLDEIEFRVITDSQVRAQALESGEVDLIATSDSSVVANYVDNDSFTMLQQNVRTETNYVLFHVSQPQLADPEVRCALQAAVDKQALIDAVYAGFGVPANGPFSPGQDGFLEDNGSPAYDPQAASDAIAAWEAENGELSFTYSTVATGTNRAAADFFQQAWSDVGVDVEIAVAEQSTFITAALLGDPNFYAFGWRNHAGLWVDTQNSWWHGFGADATGAEVVDGGLNLNFGRLNDPDLNALLDQARETEDPEERRALAQDINRLFGERCYILPTFYTTWGIIMDPAVQNIGRDPIPDGGGTLADGAGFPGQVWLASVFKTDG